MNEILDNTITEEVKLIRASRNKRFINLLIDRIAVYIIIFALSFIVTSIGMYNDSEELLEYIEDDSKFELMSYIIGWGITLLFYTLMEGLLKGKTLGKYITQTRALDEHGELLTFSKAFIRSLCRFIPFDALTFFGERPGLHDRLSKTMVVEDDETVKEHINKYF